jgi:hypothetical protein
MIADIYKDKGILGTGWESKEKMEEEVTRHISAERNTSIRDEVYDKVTKLFAPGRGAGNRR